ncbi:cadherin-like protein 26 [Notamacropus eugenii]|uniref:cadherin-like protein 26 n=1 Tax=Notamacropus eugenii TaxID=9315 RepID=UPI003B680E42
MIRVSNILSTFSSFLTYENLIVLGSLHLSMTISISILPTNLVFVSKVTVTGLQPVKDEFVNQAKMRGEDHQLLQRFKRHWVITTFELNENDPGPFPKLVGELYKNVNYSESLIYIISGPGVNKHPIGLFSIDNRNGKVYVHRSIDREEIQSFLVPINFTSLIFLHP